MKLKNIIIILSLMLVSLSFIGYADDYTYGNLYVEKNTTTHDTFIGEKAILDTLNVTYIHGAEDINATNIYQNDNKVLDESQVINFSANHSNYANSSNYWDDVDSFLADWFYTSLSDLAFNETKLNDTIDDREVDTTYSAGDGISESGEVFSVAGNTAITQDSDGLSVTDDGIGDTQLTYNTGQHLTNESNVEFNNVYATAINTGHGINELYRMNQPVQTTDDVEFANIKANEFSGAHNWTDNQHYPTACPSYSAINGNGDSNICLDAWIHRDGDTGMTGNFEFSDGNVTFESLITKDPYVDVRAFGAKCDGVTDDTVAIQSALDYGNGGKVIIPLGTCMISAQLNISRGTLLSGVATYDTILNSASEIKLMDNSNCSMIATPYAQGGGATHFIGIENLHFNGNSVNQQEEHTAIKFEGLFVGSWMNHVFISYVYGSALSLAGGADVLLDDIWILSTKTDGYAMEINANQSSGTSGLINIGQIYIEHTNHTNGSMGKGLLINRVGTIHISDMHQEYNIIGVDINNSHNIIIDKHTWAHMGDSLFNESAGFRLLSIPSTINLGIGETYNEGSNWYFVRVTPSSNDFFDIDSSNAYFTGYINQGYSSHPYYLPHYTTVINDLSLKRGGSHSSQDLKFIVSSSNDSQYHAIQGNGVDFEFGSAYDSGTFDKYFYLHSSTGNIQVNKDIDINNNSLSEIYNLESSIATIDLITDSKIDWTSPLSDYGRVLYLPLNVNTGDYAGTSTLNTLTGTTVEDGKIGKGYDFDGSDSIKYNIDSSMQEFEAITMSSWIKTGDNTHRNYIISATNGDLTAGDGNDGYGMGASFDYGGQRDVYCSYRNATKKIIHYYGDGTTISDGEWHHVVCSYNLSSSLIYIDGELQSTYNESINAITTNSSVLNIGYSWNARYLTGTIDEVQIWNRSLSFDEIKALYSQSSEFYGGEAYLLKSGGDVFGNTSFDTDTLFIDADNDRVGIGTTTPINELHVNGSGSPVVIRLENSIFGDTYYSVKVNGSTVGGFGMDSPSGNMKISNGGTINGNTQFIFSSDGYMGFGTDTPQDFMHIVDFDNETPVGIRISNIAGDVNGGSIIYLSTSTNEGSNSVGAQILANRTNADASGDTDLELRVSKGSSMISMLTIKSDGKVRLKNNATFYDNSSCLLGVSPDGSNIVEISCNS